MCWDTPLLQWQPEQVCADECPYLKEGPHLGFASHQLLYKPDAAAVVVVIAKTARSLIGDDPSARVANDVPMAEAEPRSTIECAHYHRSWMTFLYQHSRPTWAVGGLYSMFGLHVSPTGTCSLRAAVPFQGLSIRGCAVCYWSLYWCSRRGMITCSSQIHVPFGNWVGPFGG